MIHIYHKTKCNEAFEMLAKNLTLWTSTTFKAEFSADIGPLEYVFSRGGRSCMFKGSFDFDKAYDKEYLNSFSLDQIIDKIINNDCKDTIGDEIDYITIIILIIGRYDRVNGLLDKHGRYADDKKFLVQNNYSELPIVEIALELFIKRISEELKYSVSINRDFQVSFQHDVDHWDKPNSGKTIFRYMYNFLLRRRHLRLRTLPFALSSKRRINFLVSLASLNNHPPPILFLMYATATRYDSGYKLSDSDINFLKKLHASGVRIGIHPSYGGALDCAHGDKRASQHVLELENLLSSVDSKICDLRFHYLRSSELSLRRLCSVTENLTDHSVSFVRKCGFSVGTTRPHYSIDIENRQITPYLLQPLILMDSYLLGLKALNLNFDDACEYIVRFFNTCFRFGIPFTMLIHDDKLQNEEYRNWLTRVYSRLGEETRAHAK